MANPPLQIRQLLSRMLLCLASLWSLCLVAASEDCLAELVIDTVVGLHQDRGSALSATLAEPAAVVLDGSGNIYIADAQNHRIRKVDGNGTISTVAGNGVPGYSGDGGPGVEASLNKPQYLAVDPAGTNVYVADSYNHCVRKVDSAGLITTVAGTGIPGYAGDGDQATAALLTGPSGVALDGVGNLYIADSSNFRVRKVDQTGVISTFAGNGHWNAYGDGVPAINVSLVWPHGLLVTSMGELLVVDRAANLIRKVDAHGLIHTVAGNGAKGYAGDGGPALQAALAGPTAVAQDAAGNIFIADSHNQRIRKVDGNGTISTVAGEGFSGSLDDGVPATSARLRSPQGVAVDTSGAIYIADTYSQRLRKVDPGPEGKITTVAGRLGADYPDGGVSALTVRLISPHGVSVDGHGNLFVTDLRGHRVDKVSPTGLVTTVAGNGASDYTGNDGNATSASLASPSETAVDEAGNLYIADTNNHSIRKVDAEGVITTVAGTGAPGFGGDGDNATTARLNSPYGIAADRRGNVFIADTYNHRIRKLDLAGGTITTVAGTGVPGYAGDGKLAAAAQLNAPHAVAVDDQGNLYIADTHNHRIRRVDSGGIIRTVAGNGLEGYAGDGSTAVSASLSYPHGVAVDASGNVFISDAYNYRIRKVDTSGRISTLAGKGISGYGGDGGAASDATLGPPHGIAVDNSGNIYVADMTNGRIRKLSNRTP